VVVFTGNVNATRDDFTIKCEKMVLHYDELPDEKAAGKLEIRIDRIVATGQVKITRASGGVATSEKAIYYERDEKIVLTGKPVVKQENDFVEGSKITLFLKEQRSMVEGSKSEKVRAVLFPRGERGRPVVGE
jgi:lipopolysaccharide export system protein LptA